MDLGKVTAQWALQQTVGDLSLHYFAELGSTNTFAKDLLNQNLSSKPFLVLTSYQTQGRGRGEKKWQDPWPGKNLLSTWAFPMESTQPQPLSSILVGLAVAQALEKFSYFENKTSSATSPRWALKAPNDVLLEDAKVAGLLLESIALRRDSNWLLVGFGLNVFSHPETDQPTTCLSKHFSIDSLTWFEFASELFRSLSNVAGRIQRGESHNLTSKDESLLINWLNRWPPQRGLDWKKLF